MPKDFSNCAYCGRELDVPGDADSSKEEDHVISPMRGGCECDQNKVDACRGCNRGKRQLTPIEYYSYLQGKEDFDSGGYTLDQRKDFLLQAAYWEARARWHLKTTCDTERQANFEVMAHA